jgi:Peptidase inhibitor family I36
MLRLRPLALASVAAAITLGIAPTPSAAVARSAQAYSCAPGYFCIYSDWNGGGTRCQWSQQSKTNTADDCSFIQRGQNVRSVRNNTDHRVQYYTQTNYHSRVGSTPSGGQGNLQGNYQIRSFKKQ